ncbi:MAG: hypothetical protein JHD07_15580 [Bradyrhizobium sp.]|uniref:hypothetical protein n=1 Tax=Bradyrhizobium sp. TaxID=376 RepID=UPI001A1F93D6|nr:hypothetical protein [Bradyrhizobium sp.]MBJ7404635.1 hypothetical protein [Bradyrhizobium sp.]
MSSNAPRRYVGDGTGRYVLIGLTYEETLEFQRLDRLEMGRLGARADIAKRSDLGAADEELRWLELYAKHDCGWKDWVTASRTVRRDSNILKRKDRSESTACSAALGSARNDQP